MEYCAAWTRKYISLLKYWLHPQDKLPIRYRFVFTEKRNTTCAFLCSNTKKLYIQSGFPKYKASGMMMMYANTYTHTYTNDGLYYQERDSMIARIITIQHCCSSGRITSLLCVSPIQCYTATFATYTTYFTLSPPHHWRESDTYLEPYSVLPRLTGSRQLWCC